MPEGGDSLPRDPSVCLAAQSLATGDVESTLAALAPVMSSDAPPLSARFVLGMAAWRMRRLDWALELIRQCHELDPMDGTIAETYATLLAESGNLVECVYVAKIGTALGGKGPMAEFVAPGFPSFESAFRRISERPKLAQANRDREIGAFDDAIESARQHVALMPDDVEGRAFYAALLLEARRAGDAADALRPTEDQATHSAPLASLYARSLALCGESDAARFWHDAAERLAQDNAEIAAARVADGPWLDDTAALVQRAMHWAARFAPPRKAQSWRHSERLVIAYIVSALGDHDDRAAVAAVARAHDRHRAEVVAYAAGAQSWPANLELSGAFDRWRTVDTLDDATFARYLVSDGVDVVVDTSGFFSPRSLAALARVGSALRVSWLGTPAGLLAPCYDARIVAAGEDANPQAWPIGCGYPIPEARPATAVPHDEFQFGADVALAQLEERTVSLWRALLEARPRSRLILRAHDLSASAVDRMVAKFGRDLAVRIDLVSANRFEDFYARVDLALLPRRGLSPRGAAEAAACGVPALAFAGAGPYGALLRSWGGAHLVTDDGDYLWHARVAQPRSVAAAAPDATNFAHAIEAHARKALALGAAA